MWLETLERKQSFLILTMYRAISHLGLSSVGIPKELILQGDISDVFSNNESMVLEVSPWIEENEWSSF